jgi:nucleoside-diphosphate-sugar epimerase
VKRTALIAGATGISGGNLAEHLLASGWTVYGLARHSTAALPGVIPLHCDLSDADGTLHCLRGVGATHAYYCTWSRQATEEENCRVNGAMLRNFLEAIGSRGLTHVALVTGTKHYYQRTANLVADTPFREDAPRLPGENFYYVLEDILIDAAEARGFSWSVHRPNTIVGYALGNAMNLGTTLAVYASICRETGRPFAFPGSAFLYDALSQITDARLLAKHLAWASTTEGARNQAFNVANGDLFRWRWMWPRLAAYFGLTDAGYERRRQTLTDSVRDADAVWRALVDKHRLQPFEAGRLAAWWHADSDLGREFESFTDLSKSRQLGFLEYEESSRSFTAVFDRLRQEQIIPTFPPVR